MMMMCNCRHVGSQLVAASPGAGMNPASDAEDEMTQCLRWVTDAYNEFLVHGTLSEERINRLQMVYDKLRTSESMTQGGKDVQTMSNLTKMMGGIGTEPHTSTSTTTTPSVQIPSLVEMTVAAPLVECPMPTIGAGDSNPKMTPFTDNQHQISHSLGTEKPLLPVSGIPEGKCFIRDRSPDSPASSGLANSVTMEFGSENGGGAYSPFDSPFNMAVKPLHDTSRDGLTTECGGIHVQGTFMKDRASAGFLPNSSPFGSAASDASYKRLPPPPPKPPVLSPQDILAARISDEIALIEVLVRIQFELSSIGDLSTEDVAASGMTVVGPSTPPEVPASGLSPPDAAGDPKPVLGLTPTLPALPSPGSLQEMIGQSATPPSAVSQSQASTAVSAPTTQTPVTLNQADKVQSASLAVASAPQSTTSSVAASLQSILAAAAAQMSSAPSRGPVPSVASDTNKTSAVTKQPQSSSTASSETQASKETSKTSSTATKSDTANKSASKDGSEKVFFDFLVTYDGDDDLMLLLSLML